MDDVNKIAKTTVKIGSQSKIQRRNLKDDPEEFDPQYAYINSAFVQDFEDKYHESDDAREMSELEQSVRYIRRRYKNANQFYVAKKMYDDYMQSLYDKYGGQLIVEALDKAGLIEEHMPPRPKIKNNKYLKGIVESGMILSNSGTGSQDIDFDNPLFQLNLAVLARPDTSKDFLVKDKYGNVLNDPMEHYREEMGDEIDYLTDDLRKYYKLHGKGKNRGHAYRKSSGNMTTSDYIDQYFNIMEELGYDQYGMSLSQEEIQERKKRKKNYDPYKWDFGIITEPGWEEKLEEGSIQDTSKYDHLRYVNGQFISSDQAKSIDLYNKLADFGWNAYDLMRLRGISKEVAKNATGHMSKKDRKRKKKIEEQWGKYIINTGPKTYSTFDDYERDMINMQYDEIMRS